jgi:hypothetical protein
MYYRSRTEEIIIPSLISSSSPPPPCVIKTIPKLSWAWWLKPVILVTWEVEIGRIKV